MVVAVRFRVHGGLSVGCNCESKSVPWLYLRRQSPAKIDLVVCFALVSVVVIGFAVRRS
jgi:hypothetical protein